MADFFDERTDDEILANRKTVQLYIDKLLHIYKNVLDSDQMRLGILFEAILQYAKFGDDSLISKKDDPITWSAFQQYKFELDADTEKYINQSRKRAYAGHIGGKQEKAKQASASTTKQRKPSAGNWKGTGLGTGQSHNEFLNMLESEENNDDD